MHSTGPTRLTQETGDCTFAKCYVFTEIDPRHNVAMFVNVWMCYVLLPLSSTVTERARYFWSKNVSHKLQKLCPLFLNFAVFLVFKLVLFFIVFAL